MMARAYPTTKAIPTEGMDPHLSRTHLGKVALDWKQSTLARRCLGSTHLHWLSDDDTRM